MLLQLFFVLQHIYVFFYLLARMHCSARRAGYSSDSSRAKRQQTRTRPADGGPLLYDYAVDRFRHLRHRSWPHCDRAVPPAEHTTRRRPGRGTTDIAPGRRCGHGAVPRPRLLIAGWATRRRHRPRPPLRAGAGAVQAVARAGPRGPTDCAARCGLPVRRSGRQRDGSPDCTAIAGPGATRPDVGGGGSAGAGAALVRPPQFVWGREPARPRATGRHPGLLPDSVWLTWTTDGPALLKLPRHVSGQAAAGWMRAVRRVYCRGHVSRYAARAAGVGPVDGPGTSPVIGVSVHLLFQAAVPSQPSRRQGF
jgi:hypothetical protein